MEKKIYDSVSSFSLKCGSRNWSCGEEPNIKTLQESGRSILEIIAVLAVMSVITFGGFKGYEMVSKKMKMNAISSDLAALVKERQIRALDKTEKGADIRNEKIGSIPVHVQNGTPEDGDKEPFFWVDINLDKKEECEEFLYTDLLEPAFIAIDNSIPGECPGKVRLYFPKDPQDNTNGIKTYVNPTDGKIYICEGDDCSSAGGNSYSLACRTGHTPNKDKTKCEKITCSAYRGTGFANEYYAGGFVGFANDGVTRCYCPTGQTFEVDQCITSTSECSGHGSNSSGLCSCLAGYCGNNCENRITCFNAGIWTEHGCNCAEGWAGTYCDEPASNNCSNHGVYQGNRCFCNEGYYGAVCEYYNNCSGNGRVNTDGTCTCNDGYYGTDCENRENTDSCNGHGIDSGSGCVCNEGYYGTYCESYNDCSGNGQVDSNGTCTCNSSYYGADCEYYNNCSGNGRVKPDGTCTCNSSYYGMECEYYNDCSGNGRVNPDGTCNCNEGYYGTDCEDEYCSGHGTLYGGTCSCDDGWYGTYCESEGASDPCSGHGTLNANEECVCQGGYCGVVCENQVTCQHGTWTPDKCECEPNWYGPLCDSDCNGFKTDSGHCMPCDENCGFAATLLECRRCDRTDHPRLMDNYGLCHTCFRPSDFAISQAECDKCGSLRYMCGDLCILDQENVCSGHGIWGSGSCVCRGRWSGENCDTPVECDGFWGNNDTCYSCSYSSAIFTSKGECDQCANREMYKGYCALSTAGCDALHPTEGGLRDDYGNCFSCSDIGDMVTTSATECAKCDGTSNPRIMIDGNTCLSCDHYCGFSATLQECNKCSNREMMTTIYGDRCALTTAGCDALYPKGGFRSNNNGACYSCSIHYDISTTKDECDKCSNRVMDGIWCVLPTATCNALYPKGGFRGNEGTCYSCSYSKAPFTTKDECDQCATSSTPRMMDGDKCKLAPDCFGRGTKTNGTCVCNAGYSGTNCETECSGNGTITNGVCVCNSGWYGAQCDSDCNGFKGKNGTCYSCLEQNDIKASEAECSKCDNREPNKASYDSYWGWGLYCSLKCDGFFSNLGCTSCDDSTKYYVTDKQEEIVGGGGLSSGFASTRQTTSFETNKCSNRVLVPYFMSDSYYGTYKYYYMFMYELIPDACSSNDSFKTDTGACFPCSTTAPYVVSTSADCTKCSQRKVFEYNGKKYCGLKDCSGFSTLFGYCDSCSAPDSSPDGVPATSADECARCNSSDASYPRLEYNGTCYSCRYTGTLSVSAEACAQCDGTNYPREMVKNKCVLTTAGCNWLNWSGGFRGDDGSCNACYESPPVLTSDSECAKCDGRTYNRFRGTDGKCYKCVDAGNVRSTAAQCAKCGSSRTYYSSVSECVR